MRDPKDWGKSRPQWKAVDFDATLAVFNYETFEPGKTGEPIMAMVERVRYWLANGIKVSILTARVHPYHSSEDVEAARTAIQDFCMKQFGQKLEVTCEKSPKFTEIWDDKAVGVVPNTGEVAVYEEVGYGVQLDGSGDPLRDLLRLKSC